MSMKPVFGAAVAVTGATVPYTPWRVELSRPLVVALVVFVLTGGIFDLLSGDEERGGEEGEREQT
jgi:uncharacterized integral membrane protein